MVRSFRLILMIGLCTCLVLSCRLAHYDAFPRRQLGAPNLNVSYKPQKISPRFEGTVRQLLHKRIRDAYIHPQVGVGARTSEEFSVRSATRAKRICVVYLRLMCINAGTLRTFEEFSARSSTRAKRICVVYLRLMCINAGTLIDHLFLYY